MIDSYNVSKCGKNGNSLIFFSQFALKNKNKKQKLKSRWLSQPPPPCPNGSGYLHPFGHIRLNYTHGLWVCHP
jgi:hypothetical protein